MLDYDYCGLPAIPRERSTASQPPISGHQFIAPAIICQSLYIPEPFLKFVPCANYAP